MFQIRWLVVFLCLFLPFESHAGFKGFGFRDMRRLNRGHQSSQRSGEPVNKRPIADATSKEQSDDNPPAPDLENESESADADFKKAQKLLASFLARQKEGIQGQIQDHIRTLLNQMDRPEKLLEALNALFFDDQLSVTAAGIEKELFGKKLSEFSEIKDRHLLAKAYTEGQKEYRDLLITGIAKGLSNSSNPAALQLGKALLEAKPKHLEAYDKAIKDIPNTDGKDTWCFTCNPTGEIGEGSGYTFEEAMNGAIAGIMTAMKTSRKPQAQLPTPLNSPSPKKETPKPPTQKDTPKRFLPDHSGLSVPGLSGQGSSVPGPLRQTVENLLQGKQVLLLGNPTGCPPCQRAAAFLRQKGIPFEEAPVRSNAQAGQLFRELRGQKFPLMIHSDGKGGFIYRYPNW